VEEVAVEGRRKDIQLSRIERRRAGRPVGRSNGAFKRRINGTIMSYLCDATVNHTLETERDWWLVGMLS